MTYITIYIVIPLTANHARNVTKVVNVIFSPRAVKLSGGFYNDTLTGVCLNFDLDNTIYVTSPELEPDALWSYSENNNNNNMKLR